MSKGLYLVFACIFLMFSCHTPDQHPVLKQMEWLLGTWKSDSPEVPFYENWTKVSDSSYININFTVCNGDTIVNERAKIEMLNQEIVYTGNNILRSLISMTDSVCVFENTDLREKFTFSLNHDGHWIAQFSYADSQTEYNLSRTKPLPELLKEKSIPLDGHYEGYCALNAQKLMMSIDFKMQDGKQAAFISIPQNLIYNDLLKDVCYNAPNLIFKKEEGDQQITFMGIVKGDTIEGRMTGELPATFRLIKSKSYQVPVKSYAIEDIELQNGAIKLPASLFLPKMNHPTPAIVMIAGSGKHTKEEFYGWADLFASHGIATLIYDKRDVSDHAYPNLKLTLNTGNDIVLLQDLVDDASTAVQYLASRTEIDHKHTGIWGISQGGIVAPLLMEKQPGIAFVIVVSAPTTKLFETYHFQMLNHLMENVKSVDSIQKVETLWALFDNHIIHKKDLNDLRPKFKQAYAEGWGQLTNIPEDLPTSDDVKYNFAYNSMGLDMSVFWTKINVPVYAVYGSRDMQVPEKRSVEVLNQVFEQKKKLLTIKEYPDADHLIKKIQDKKNPQFSGYAPGYIDEMLNWLEQQVKK